MNKTIKIEIAVGIILVIAVLIGGFIWLGSRSDNSAQIQVNGKGVKVNGENGNIQIQGDMGQIKANAGTEANKVSGTQASDSGNVQFHTDDNGTTIKTKNGSVSVDTKGDSINSISASGDLKTPKASINDDGSIKVTGPLGGSVSVGDDGIQVKGPDTGN